jgi:tetratricopeptide (TPR) repeat protein
LTRARRAALRLVPGLALALAPAWAGPPWPAEHGPRDVDEVDPGVEDSFWANVVDPERARYAALIELALHQLADPDRSKRDLGEATLRDAVALAPDRPLAHLWLGRALAGRADHAGCALELATVRRLDPRFTPPSGDWPQPWGIELELGLCQARAGALHAAERTFAAIIERGVEEVAVLERLADVRMAQGRLDEAQVALERARRREPLAAGPDFALAVSYDREDDPTRVREHLERATGRDPRLLQLAPTTRPYAPLGDEHYYAGVALEYLGARSRALFHFRRYAAAGESPWGQRARAHLVALAADANDRELQVRGSAAIDLAHARRALGAVSGELDACVAPAPTLLLELSLTRSTGAGTGGEAPAPGVRVIVIEQHGVALEVLRTVVECVEAAAAHVVLPRIRGVDGSYVTLTLPVIAR